MIRRRDFFWLIGIGGLYKLGLSASRSSAHQDHAAMHRTAGRQVIQLPAPTFTLTDQDGAPFTSSSWHGRMVVVTFGYTACPDVCPILTANLALLQQELPEAVRLQTGLLFITTDPEHDTPPVLRAYGTGLGVDFSSWKFLTGQIDQLQSVWQGFGVLVQKWGPGQVDHTTLTTLVDPRGIRRLNYYGTRWHPQTIRRDLVALMPKKASGM